MTAFVVWLGCAWSRIGGWWLRRHDRRLPPGFFGEDTQ